MLARIFKRKLQGPEVRAIADAAGSASTRAYLAQRSLNLNQIWRFMLFQTYNLGRAAWRGCYLHGVIVLSVKKWR